MHENREISSTPSVVYEGPPAEAPSRTADVYALEKPDCAVVPVNQPNKAVQTAAEVGGGNGADEGEHRSVTHAPDTPTTIVCGSLRFDRASLKPITQLLPSFILIEADQARTLALHNTMQALASEMAEQPRFCLSRHSGCISRRDRNAAKDGFVRFLILKWALP